MTGLPRRSFVLHALGSAATVAIPTLSRTAQSPVLGVSLPLTGPQAEVAKEIAIGYQLAMQASNNVLTLKILDDESKAEKTAENIKRFGEDASVIAASGIVGTPHAQAAIPIAMSLGLPLVGIRSGSPALRKGQGGVFHLRSSFDEELTKVAAMCKGGGIEKMAILFSNDSFGTEARDSLTASLKSLNIDIVSSVPVDRNGENIDKATQALASEVKSKQGAVGIALLLISKPMQAAAALLRNRHKLISPMFVMSFVATKGFSASTDEALIGMGIVTAFPMPRIDRSPTMNEFRALAEKQGLGAYVESHATYEGYFYGLVAAKATSAGSSLASRERVVQHLNTGVDVGDTKIRFDSRRVGFKHLQILVKSNDGKLRA